MAGKESSRGPATIKMLKNDRQTLTEVIFFVYNVYIHITLWSKDSFC